MKLKAMTYNIASGNNLQKDRNLAYAAEIINLVQPDIVTVNEVCKNTAYAPQHQADVLGSLTGYYPVFGRSIDIAGGEYGNAFLVRRPLIEWKVIDIPDRRSEERNYYEHRTMLRAVIDVNGQKLTVLSTHFGLAKVEQESAVETALSVLKDETNPVILMGDLNMEPDDPILTPLLDALHDSAERKKDIKTFPSDEPTIKIDYILHSGEFKTVSLASMDTQNSDHRPLFAELEIG